MATVGYVTTSNFGGTLAIEVGKVADATGFLGRLKDAAFAAYSAAGNSWAALEGGDFGADTGQGQAYYDAINGLYTALTTVNAVAFRNQLDKGA